MRWIPQIALALALGLTGSAAAQDSKDEPEDDIDIDELLADVKPKGEEPEAEAEPEAKPEPTVSEKEKADKASLDLVSYPARATFDSQYFGYTLVRAERHLGHLDVYFIAKDGTKMMAEVRPDNSLGKVEKSAH